MVARSTLHRLPGEDKGMTAITIAFANHKGGVGKTASTINVAYCLNKRKKRVLVVDCDPQGNAALTLGTVSPYEQPRTVANLFSGSSFSQTALPSKYEGLDLIPANLNVYATVSTLSNSIKRFFGFRQALDEAALNRYDYILLDCPPTIEGTLLTNALVIADYVIIPVGVEDTYALSGVSHLIKVIETLRADAESRLAIMGVLLTMFDGRNTAAKAIRSLAISTFGEDMVFSTTIPRNTTLNKAVMASKAVCEFDDTCASCRSYRELAQEIENRVSR